MKSDDKKISFENRNVTLQKPICVILIEKN